MSKLIVGSRSSVFVTHVEFAGSGCQIFCQVGNVGSQADTIAERVADCIENGASQISHISVGDICLALFHEDNSWYRARVLQNSGQNLKVFFIDYGNTETVSLENTRESPEYVMAIPALSTKCVIDNCTPISGSSWTEAEKKKLETMLHSGEFTIEVTSVNESEGLQPHYNAKLFSLDAPNTPVFVRPAVSSEQSLPTQSLQIGSQYEVFIVYVESAKKFYVQLKSQENELNSLMSDIAACFAEDLPSTGDVVNAVEGQVCASCFSEDCAFYRGIVQKIQGSECTVFYVDYGNHEKKSKSELFTLPQALCKLPIQAIMCYYKVEGGPSVEDKLHELTASDSAHIMTVVTGNSRQGYEVKVNAVEQTLTSSSHQSKPVAAQPSNSGKLWQNYSTVIMQVEGIYDVCLSYVEHPGRFFVQLIANAPNLDTVMAGIEEVAHNYDRLTNCYAGYPCLAKFSDGAWYRGEVMSVADGKISVAAVDFGFSEVFSSSQLKNTDPVFKELPAQAILCTLDINKTQSNTWSGEDTAKFKALSEKSALVAKVSTKKGNMYQLDLYETQGDQDKFINEQFGNAKSQVISKPQSQVLPKSQNHMQQPQAQTRPAFASRTPAVSVPSPDVSLGSKITLCITALKWPIVFGQVTHTSVDKVAKLQTDLNSYYDGKTRDVLQGATVGSMCSTQYVDGGWYRGMVTSVQGNKFDVTFIDFGDGVSKSSNDLKVLPANLCELPQQCVQCLLDNVPSSVATDKIERAMVNNRVEMQLLRKADNVFPTYHVEVGQQILDRLHDGPGRSSQGGFNKTQSSRGLGAPGPSLRPPRQDMTSLRRKPSGDSGFTHQEVAVGGSQEVMVTYVKDPSHFQIVLDKMSPSLDMVMDQLHEYYDKLPPNGDQLDNPHLGQPCVAQFSEDKGWYRAVVTGLKASGPAEVKFVDYGNNEYTDREALKTIKQQFMALPAQAVTCSLAGVASSQDFWSPEHIVQFEEMVIEQCFTGTFTSELQEHSNIVYKVELVDQKGTNINQKFGSMTNTLRAEPAKRSMSGTMITVSGTGDNSGWDDAGSGPSFGGKSGGFGGRGDGGRGSFGGNRRDEDRSGGGFGGRDRGSGGFGDRGSGGGFGGRDRGSGGGFGGGDRGSGGGFGGGDRGSGGGFGGRDRGSGGGFGGGDRGSGGGFGGGDRGSGGFGSGERSSGGRGFGGGGGGSRDCFKCGESGHISRECPNAGTRGGGGGSRDCFKCGESGHISRECPNAAAGGGGGGGSRDCFKCGESGHISRDCPNAGGGGGRKSGGSECYKCGETGHFARDCTNPQSTGKPRSGGGFGGRDTGSGGGFGRSSGGFGSRGGRDESAEDWGDGPSKGGSGGGGFGSRGGGGGFGGKSESGGGFGSRGGGAFGSGGGGGFGQKKDDWGDSNNNSGGQKGGGFGSQRAAGSGGGFGSTAGGSDDWDTEASGSGGVQQAGDGPARGKVRFADQSDSSKSLSYTPLTMDMRETADVYVVYTAKPDQFWCQLIKNSTQLEKLMEDISRVYNGLAEGDMLFDRPVVGSPCAAKFSEDNTWYRAKVVSVGASEADVLFVDYGNSEKVPVSSLKQLKSEFITLKTQAIKCGLDGVLPIDNKWTDKSVEDFEDLTVDKHLVAKVVGTNRDIYQIDLENVEEKVDIGEAMCDKGHCDFVSAAKISPKKEPKVPNPYQLLNMETGKEIDVYVSWIENPEKFWIQPVSHETALINLTEKVQEVYTTGAGVNLSVPSLKTGGAVVSIYSEDGAWYRAYIEQSRGNACKVRFVDYGNSDDVKIESLRQPTEELLKIPSQAVKCCLTGIRPLQAGSWTSDAKDIMDSLVTDKVVKCTVTEVKDGVSSVNIVADGVDISQELIKAAVVRAERDQTTKKATSHPGTPMEILRFKDPVVVGIGATESAYVTQTESVASFWCQLSKFYPQLEDVMAKLESFCKSNTDVEELSVGMACGAKFSEDNSWYRASISAVYPDTVEVLFVDYGNTEKVTTSDICLLTHELVELSPQAVQCEMGSTVKASNQLTSKFIELTADQEVQITVTDIQEGISVISMKLADGRSVSDALGLTTPSESASLPPADKAAPVKDSTLVLRDSTPASSKSQMYPVCKSPSEPTNVYVTQVNGLESMYIQRTDQETSLNELMEKIAETYSDTSDSMKLDIVQTGQACVAKYSEDDAWYRAEVMSTSHDKVCVRFVDYGNSEDTTLNNVRKISDDLLQVTPYAIKCRLSGVVPLENTWSKEANDKFIELTADKELVCTFVSSEAVTLSCEGEDVGETLVKSNLVSGPSKVSKAYPPQSVPADSAACYVAHVDELVYLQLVCEEDTLNTLTEEIQSLEQGTPVSLDSVKVGDPVCAKFSEDHSWYRAEVLSADPASVKVRFVDYGNCDMVTDSAGLRDLPEQWLSTPALAYSCCLSGLKTMMKKQQEILIAATADKQLTVTFLTTAKVFDIELLDNRVSVLELFSSSNQNDAKSDVQEEVVEEKAEEDSAEVDKHLTDEQGEVVEEKVEEEKSTEVEVQPNQQIEESDDQKAVVDEDSGTDVDITCLVNTLEELAHEKLEDRQRVKVSVAHSESPSEFWVHLEANKQKLDDLLNSMFDFYSTEISKKLVLDSVEKGCVMAALYSEDESWYRASVLDTDVEGVHVKFVDHGNTECSSKDNLRKLPKQFGELPIQGIQCKLGAVQPAGEEWSEKAVETFSELTQNKCLLLDVGGVSGEGVYTVQLLDMGMSVSDQLLQKDIGAEIATPVAVSTKVKQVFSPEDSENVIARLYDVKAADKVGPYGYKLRDVSWLCSQYVVLRTVISPEEIWCQLQDNTYEYFQDKLQSHYQEQQTQLTDITEGDRCVIHDGNDYLRASVQSVQADTVTVKIVDRGDDSTVPKSSIFKLDPEFQDYPQLSFLCKLANIEPHESETWSEEVCKSFKDIVIELSGKKDLPASAKATMVLKDKGVLDVELDMDRKCLSSALVEKGLGKFLEAGDSTLEEGDITQKFDSFFGDFKNVELKCDSEFAVTLVDCDNLDQLVFHTETGTETLAEIAKKIEEFVANQTTSEEDVEFIEDNPCLVKCPEDNLWYRGVMKYKKESNYQVFLVDYGSSYTVVATSILPLPADLLEVPAQAVLASLDDIEPTEDHWSEDCHAYFQEHYMDVDLNLYVSRYGKGIHHVMLFEKEEIEGSVNKHLTELGLATPVLGSQLEMSMLGENAEMSFHELSMSRQDSFGSSGEQGDTSYEPDTSDLLDTTEETTGVTDTSCVTDTADTSASTVDGESTDQNGKHTDSETECLCLQVEESKKETPNICEIVEDIVYQAGRNEGQELAEGVVRNNQDDLKEVCNKTDTKYCQEIEKDDYALDTTRDTEESLEYSTSDVEPRSTEESELDESYRPFGYSPTGYTTSELDTTDLQDCTTDSSGLNINDTSNFYDTSCDVDSLLINLYEDSSTDVTDYFTTSEVDTTDQTDYDTTGLEDIDTSDQLETETTDIDSTYESNACLQSSGETDTANTTNTTDTTNTEDNEHSKSTAEEQIAVSVSINEEGVEIDSKECEDINSNVICDKKCKHVEESDLKIDEQHVVSQPVESKEDYNDKEAEACQELGQAESMSDRKHDDGTGHQTNGVSRDTYPSVSDTTYPSSLTSAGDCTFTSLVDTSQTDSMVFCDNCTCEMSSCLETTDCESEFSYHVCPECESMCPHLRDSVDRRTEKEGFDENGYRPKESEVIEIAGEISEEVENESLSPEIEVKPTKKAEILDKDNELQVVIDEPSPVKHDEKETGDELNKQKRTEVEKVHQTDIKTMEISDVVVSETGDEECIADEAKADQSKVEGIRTGNAENSFANEEGKTSANESNKTGLIQEGTCEDTQVVKKSIVSIKEELHEGHGEGEKQEKSVSLFGRFVSLISSSTPRKNNSRLKNESNLSQTERFENKNNNAVGEDENIDFDIGSLNENQGCFINKEDKDKSQGINSVGDDCETAGGTEPCKDVLSLMDEQGHAEAADEYGIKPSDSISERVMDALIKEAVSRPVKSVTMECVTTETSENFHGLPGGDIVENDFSVNTGKSRLKEDADEVAELSKHVTENVLETLEGHKARSEIAELCEEVSEDVPPEKDVSKTVENSDTEMKCITELNKENSKDDITGINVLETKEGQKSESETLLDIIKGVLEQTETDRLEKTEESKAGSGVFNELGTVELAEKGVLEICDVNKADTDISQVSDNVCTEKDMLRNDSEDSNKDIKDVSGSEKDEDKPEELESVTTGCDKSHDEELCSESRDLSQETVDGQKSSDQTLEDDVQEKTESNSEPVLNGQAEPTANGTTDREGNEEDSEKEDFEDAKDTEERTKEKSPDKQITDTDKNEENEFFDVAEDKES